MKIALSMALGGKFFIDQLLPLVEGSYRVDGRRENRAIGGISRGGFWAYHIGLRYPELFSAIGGHSAFFDRYHAPADSNPLDLALNAPDIERMRLWLDRGMNDYAAPGLDMMDQRLRQRGIPYQYTIYPTGEHNNAYWSGHVADYIQFYSALWHGGITPSADLGILPSQAQPLLFVTNTPRPPVRVLNLAMASPYFCRWWHFLARRVR